MLKVDRATQAAHIVRIKFAVRVESEVERNLGKRPRRQENADKEDEELPVENVAVDHGGVGDDDGWRGKLVGKRGSVVYRGTERAAWDRYSLHCKSRRSCARKGSAPRPI